jgi:hypothetical protein
MSDFVQLYWKRNRGWPWPEDSWGLTPMFGEDGWCHSCGVPKHAQTGSLILQRKGMKVEGGWVPNWQFDPICLERSVAEEAASRFNLELLKVDWHGSPPGDAMQIVVPSVGEAWFDPDELREKTIERHGTAGATCSECGVWRWMPLLFGFLPPLRITPGLGDADIAASPEWFGDGWKAFRQILVRGELAELIADASPRDFKVQLVS